jgi:hypothetical protein
MDLTGIDSEALRQAAELSNRSARELEQIANALQDASVTSQAAQSIQAGDYERAAEQINELSKSLESLSPEARRDLAERLKQAAQDLQATDPDLAQRLDQASKGLASRSDRAAAQGLEDLSKAISETGKNVIPQAALAEAMGGEEGASINDDGPARARSSQPGEGEGGELGEGEAGENGFGASEGSLAIGSSGGMTLEDGSGGSGAGQGSGTAGEEYSPRINPSGSRAEVPIEQGTGPTAPRLGKNQPGAPDVITTGPGTTGPGNQPQSGVTINTGLDANRVPRGLRSVVEGYFRVQK